MTATVTAAAIAALIPSVTALGATARTGDAVGAPAVADSAAASATPATDVLLIVDGAVDPPDGADDARFDLAALQALPQVEIVTRTPWSEGTQRFEGPTLADVLDAAGAGGARVSALGLDEYKAEIEIREARRYPIVVALLHDGEPMSVRRLGPLRIVYPFDDHPALDTLGGHARSVWQLVRLTVLE